MEGWSGVSSLRLTGLDSGHMGLIPPSRGLLIPGPLPHIFKVPSLTPGVQASKQHFGHGQLQPSYKPRAPGYPFNIPGPLFSHTLLISPVLLAPKARFHT